MATDTRTSQRGMAPEMTLAELCEAIADGRLSYSVSDDGQYEIRAGDVRRLRHGRAQMPLELPVAGGPKIMGSHAS